MDCLQGGDLIPGSTFWRTTIPGGGKIVFGFVPVRPLWRTIMAKTDKATEPKILNKRLMSANVAKSELEWFAKRKIEQLEKIKTAASKLAQCFPKKEGQKFDIPRYVIDELENALEGN